MHDPRVRPSLGLGHMVNPHGPDHCSAIFDDWFDNEMGIQKLHPVGITAPLSVDDTGPRKVALFRYEQIRSLIKDSMVICVFPEYSWDMLVDLVKAATGWDTGLAELIKIAERSLTVARLFNLREGISEADESLPERFFQPKTDGPLATRVFDRRKLEKARDYYYLLMGWVPEVFPWRKKLKSWESNKGVVTADECQPPRTGSLSFT